MKCPKCNYEIPTSAAAAEMGRKGGKKSRRKLTSAEARRMALKSAEARRKKKDLKD